MICFSLLNGLAERGHQIYAYANTAPIQAHSPNLYVKTGQHKVPANSLAPWEQAWRAEKWMKELERSTKFDLVWRMHPYGGGCPTVPKTGGLPLVVGPLFTEWPADFSQPQNTGLPRFGVSLQKIVTPSAERGWQQTLERASLLVCATDARAKSLQEEYPSARAVVTPVIIESPFGEDHIVRSAPNVSRPLKLLIAAHFVPNKNLDIFCRTVKMLCDSGIRVKATILGDGPGRVEIAALLADNDLTDTVCLKGKLPHAQVWEHLRDADLLLSCSGYEAYGRTIVEAMSVGTPAVCYYGSRGPAEIVTDEINGLLVSALTAEAYANRIAALLARPGAWEALSANALRAAEQWRSAAVLDILEDRLVRLAAGK